MMLASALLLGLAAAVAAKKCQNMTTAVQVTSRNAVYNISIPKTDIEVTNFMLNLGMQSANYSGEIAAGFKTVSKQYRLAATYCEPWSGKSKALQVLTHGIGFDRSYWDYAYNYNYSYVDKALARDYSTLSYDRLGIGMTSRGKPLSEVQLGSEIAALGELTRQIRAGQLLGGKHKGSKIWHVGHSFGAAISFMLTNESPTMSDGLILTGFNAAKASATFMPAFLLGANFVSVKKIASMASRYPKGYLGASGAVGMQQNFFGPGDFDAKMLPVATLQGQPASVGELLTLSAMTPGGAFKGPVMIVTGDRDIPFCGGDCMNVESVQGPKPANLLKLSKANFESASVFNATVIPGAGHGLNLQYSAPRTYRAMLDFADRHA